VIIVATVAFVQEYRSEQTLEALNTLVPHRCNVLRGGQMCSMLAEELVPGDIVYLASGDRVPADGRIVSCSGLLVDESTLTGETHPRDKTADALPDAEDGISTSGSGCLSTGASNSVGTNASGGGASGASSGGSGVHDRHNMVFMGTLVSSGNATVVVISTGLLTEFGKTFQDTKDVEKGRTPLQVSLTSNPHYCFTANS
jgi:Ca2+-transporting ATPase